MILIDGEILKPSLTNFSFDEPFLRTILKVRKISSKNQRVITELYACLAYPIICLRFGLWAELYPFFFLAEPYFLR